MKRTVSAGLIGVVLVVLSSGGPALRVRSRVLAPALFRPDGARTVLKSQLPVLVTTYWLRVVNAIGEGESEAHNRALADYGHLLTTLDPQFYHVYFYLGLCIPFRRGVGVYSNQREAADLLRRGVDRFPNDIKLRTIYGYTLFEMLSDFRGAAAQFEFLANMPDAPPYAARLRARLLTQSGEASGLGILEELAAACPPDDFSWDCERVRKELRELRVELALQQVEKANTIFKGRTGRDATSLAELVESGDYVGPAADPEGQPIELRDGKATSASLSRRFEVYH
jgi:hypothetical protein